jgi:hypothetical protein
MGLNLIPYDYSVSVGVYQDDWLRLVSQDSHDLVFVMGGWLDDGVVALFTVTD